MSKVTNEELVEAGRKSGVEVRIVTAPRGMRGEVVPLPGVRQPREENDAS